MFLNSTDSENHSSVAAPQDDNQSSTLTHVTAHFSTSGLARGQSPEISRRSGEVPAFQNHLLSHVPSLSPRSSDFPSRPPSTPIPHESQTFDIDRRSPVSSHRGEVGQSLSRPSSVSIMHEREIHNGESIDLSANSLDLVIPVPEDSRDRDSSVFGSRAASPKSLSDPASRRFEDLVAPTPEPIYRLDGPSFSELLVQDVPATLSRHSGAVSGVTSVIIPRDPEIDSSIAKGRAGQFQGFIEAGGHVSGMHGLVDTMPVLGDGIKTLNVDDDICSTSSENFPPAPHQDMPLRGGQVEAFERKPLLSTHAQPHAITHSRADPKDSIPASSCHEISQASREGDSAHIEADRSALDGQVDENTNPNADAFPSKEDARSDLVDEIVVMPRAHTTLENPSEGGNFSQDHLGSGHFFEVVGREDIQQKPQIAHEECREHGSITEETNREEFVAGMADGIEEDHSSTDRQPQGMVKSAAKLTMRAPCCCGCCGIFIVLGIAALGIGLLGVEVETDFSAFMKTDVNSSTLWDGFTTALKRRSTNRRLSATLYRSQDIHIMYELKDQYFHDGANMFDNLVLSKVAKIEKELLSSHGWQAYCNTTLLESRAFCKYGLTLSRFAFPSVVGDVVPTKMTFDGGGRDQVPVETTIQVLEMPTFKLAGNLLPMDFDRAAWQSTRYIRSSFRFKWMCCSSSDPMTVQSNIVNGIKKEFKKFVEEIVLPYLQSYGPGSEKADELPFNVYYDGNDFSTLEVMQALRGDIILAAGSMLFVLVYIISHTGSVFLGLISMLIIIISLPLSYVVFAVLAGSTTMSVASFLSLFLIVGLGSDTIFVYTDFWRNSARLFPDDGAQRLMWTLKFAGKASLATSATTALSFFANLASVLKPLREFGFFMGLCVVVVWLLISLIYLPFCLVDDYWLKRCQIKCSNSDSKDSYTASLLEKWLSRLFPHRVLIVICYALFAVTALAFALAFVTTDTSGDTALFPPEHNRVAGRLVQERFRGVDEVFDPLYILPPNYIDVCGATSGPTSTCVISWCEAHPGEESTTGNSCKCVREMLPQNCDTPTALMTFRFVGATPSHAELQTVASERVNTFGNLQLSPGDHFTTRALAPLVLQQWETGDTMYKSFLQAEAVPQRLGVEAPCGWNEMCFCGSYSCLLQNYEPAPDATISSLGHSRRLQDLPSFRRAEIVVLFGLSVNTDSPLLGELDEEDVWSFDQDFELAQPWAQRSIAELCDNPAADLVVASTLCWIQTFRTWVKQQGERFPVPKPKFSGLLNGFMGVGLTGTLTSKDYLWFDGGDAKACYIRMFVNFDKDSSADAALEYKKLWDDFIFRTNEEATRFSRGAWHTSQLWVRAEAQKELILSTVITLIIVLVLAFIGMLIFTFDTLLSLSVVVATIVVICGLAFFMTCVMQWPIGPIEIIALIVFIGYAVTYSLHIAHKFGADIEKALEGDDIPNCIWDEGWKVQIRYHRTNFAMKSIGGAALGSAITTIGCSIFLICCQLTIFQRLGSVVIFISGLSIFTALAPLPAGLLLVGPLSPGKSCCPCFHDVSAQCPEWFESFGIEEKKSDGWEVNEEELTKTQSGNPALLSTREGNLDLHGVASRRKTAPARNSPNKRSSQAFAQSVSSPAHVARAKE